MGKGRKPYLSRFGLAHTFELSKLWAILSAHLLTQVIQMLLVTFPDIFQGQSVTEVKSRDNRCQQDWRHIAACQGSQGYLHENGLD